MEIVLKIIIVEFQVLDTVFNGFMLVEKIATILHDANSLAVLILDTNGKFAFNLFGVFFIFNELRYYGCSYFFY